MTEESEYLLDDEFYLAYSNDHDRQDAIRNFKRIYGYEPEGVYAYKGYILVGPVKEEDRNE